MLINQNKKYKFSKNEQRKAEMLVHYKSWCNSSVSVNNEVAAKYENSDLERTYRQPQSLQTKFVHESVYCEVSNSTDLTVLP